MRKYGSIVVAVAGLLTGVLHAQSLPPGCHPVKGKIVNNINTPAMLHTLGVAAVVVSSDTDIKLKCALEGTPVPPPNPQDPGSVAFHHTISCDDAISTASGPVHSQLQFSTVGTVNPSTGFFIETSTPLPSTGTGLFQGIIVTQSYLSIEGRILPNGTVDQTFTGRACY
jgi:hypothetical protein